MPMKVEMARRMKRTIKWDDADDWVKSHWRRIWRCTGMEMYRYGGSRVDGNMMAAKAG